MSTVEESNEVWKQIEGFENYEVSTKGNVRNIKTQKLLKPNVRNSYLRVQLGRNEKKKQGQKAEKGWGGGMVVED
jgi:hypothetical protein